MRIVAVAVGAFEQRVEAEAILGCEIEADDFRFGQLFVQRRDDVGEGLFDEQHFHRGVGEDEHLLGHGETEIHRHQHRAQPRAGIEQHQVIGAVEAENGDAIAARDAAFGFQRAGGLRDACVELRVAERAALEAQCRLVRREGGVARDEIGEVHPWLPDADWRLSVDVHGLSRLHLGARW